jgi:hypothetical protein
LETELTGFTELEVRLARCTDQIPQRGVPANSVNPVNSVFILRSGYFNSFLLSKITPTIATSSSTETISNGSR